MSARPATARLGRWVVLLVAAVYFIGPLIAAIKFTLVDGRGHFSFSAYRDIFASPGQGQSGLGSALLYSVLIAVVTIVVTIVLLVPTQLLLHLRLPRWRGPVETITLLPLVFPPVVLVVGVSDVYGWAAPTSAGVQRHHVVFQILRFVRDNNHPLLLVLLYTALAMPFAYRAIDAGIRSVDVHVLTEAARNLGAGWGTVVVRVLMPTLRTALVNASFLCFALVMGEYTIASILLYTKPFPVWLADLPTNSGQVQAAVSVFSLLFVEAILLLLGVLTNRRRAGTRS